MRRGGYEKGAAGGHSLDRFGRLFGYQPTVVVFVFAAGLCRT